MFWLRVASHLGHIWVVGHLPHEQRVLVLRHAEASQPHKYLQFSPFRHWHRSGNWNKERVQRCRSTPHKYSCVISVRGNTPVCVFLLHLERISLNNAVKYFCADCVWPGMSLGARGPIQRIPVDVKQAGVRRA